MEISKINSLALSWTIVYPIDDASSFYGLTKEDIADTDIEIMIFVKAFDEVFSNKEVSRTSYVSDEIIWGGKFKMMYHPNNNMWKTILSLNKINEYEKINF